MTHADDGALVRLLDGAGDAAERAWVGNHVAGCAACASRYGTIERHATLVRDALGILDEVVPRRRGRGLPWLRVAAGVLVFLGIAGTVKPVRAWFVEGAHALWAVFAGGDADPAGPSARAADGPDPSNAIAFTPVGPVFRLELASYQRGGTLLIETSERGTAEAEIHGGSGEESLVVLPGGLRIANRPGSHARYVVRLPRSLTAVRVAVGGESTLAIAPAGASTRWEIDLVRAAEPPPDQPAPGGR